MKGRVEIPRRISKKAKRRNPEINFINSTIEDLDIESKKYDLVFTDVVLIHQNPMNLHQSNHFQHGNENQLSYLGLHFFIFSIR